jgi:hypothetical protein
VGSWAPWHCKGKNLSQTLHVIVLPHYQENAEATWYKVSAVTAQLR